MKRTFIDHEKQYPKIHGSVYHSRYRRCCYGVPRKLRLVIIYFTTVLVIAILLLLVRHERDYTLKRSPTSFSSLLDLSQPTRGRGLWHAPHPVRWQNGTHIDERYIFMRHLGAGREGSASLYVDVSTGEVVVVKTYTGVPRNPVPTELAYDFEDYTEMWQVEIEASLHFSEWRNGNETAFVPVRDYFILESGSEANGKKWEWALVTPFVEDGTLETLAKSTQVHERTPQKLDKIFRPVFDKLLESLKLLHDSGFCHDDIKSDNIFIADTKHWLLGDLGNVRQFEHPWHSTRRVKRENQWSNCVLNDVRRLLQTYMTFLREACGNSVDFDREFYREQQAWSKLYWAWMRQPVNISATQDLSQGYDSSKDPEAKAESGEIDPTTRRSCLQRKIDLELTSTTLHFWVSDYWRLRAC